MVTHDQDKPQNEEEDLILNNFLTITTSGLQFQKCINEWILYHTATVTSLSLCLVAFLKGITF